MSIDILDHVVLVDELDAPIGSMEKLEAHMKGVLHRAFSIFIFNDRDELLIHRRALEKYHSGGLWTNTCCSHPRPGELDIEAATRRLKEEMGFSCELQKVTSFIYRAHFDNGLIEHEFDHIWTGNYNDDPIPDPSEVEEWKYISLDVLNVELDKHPENFSVWFQLAMPKIMDWKRNNNNATLS
jgi:isopentenyl-diphosphate delta-isomerase